MKSLQFAELQLELFGEKALENLKCIGSTHDLEELAAMIMGTKHTLLEKETVDISDEGGEGFDDFMSYMNGSDSKNVVKPSIKKVAADEKV